MNHNRTEGEGCSSKSRFTPQVICYWPFLGDALVMVYLTGIVRPLSVCLRLLVRFDELENIHVDRITMFWAEGEETG